MSRSGISLSVGKQGATLNFSKRGLRQTGGIQGSGLSHSSHIVKNKSDEEKENEKDDRGSEGTTDSKERNESPERGTSRRGRP